MIPLKDENPTSRPAIVTVLLILACAAVWFAVQEGQPATRTIDVGGEGQVQVAGDLAFNLERAAIPCEITSGEPLDLDEITRTFQGGDEEACSSDGRGGDFDAGGGRGAELFPGKSVWLAALVSMFLHGGLLHLGGNLLFLWIFGNNVEDRLGHVGYLAFYLLGGVVATAAYVLVNPDSTVPLVGASGAIAAVMGAYLVWHPNAPIKTVVTAFVIFFTEVRAKWLLGFWFVLQFFTSENSGVAWVAHVGGFLAGVLFGLALGPGRRPELRYGR